LSVGRQGGEGRRHNEGILTKGCGGAGAADRQHALAEGGTCGKSLAVRIWEEGGAGSERRAGGAMSDTMREKRMRRESERRAASTCGYEVEHYWADGGLRMKLLGLVGGEWSFWGWWAGMDP
jgi:hypothetical protein